MQNASFENSGRGTPEQRRIKRKRALDDVGGSDSDENGSVPDSSAGASTSFFAGAAANIAGSASDHGDDGYEIVDVEEVGIAYVKRSANSFTPINRSSATSFTAINQPSKDSINHDPPPDDVFAGSDQLPASSPDGDLPQQLDYSQVDSPEPSRFDGSSNGDEDYNHNSDAGCPVSSTQRTMHDRVLAAASALSQRQRAESLSNEPSVDPCDYLRGPHSQRKTVLSRTPSRHKQMPGYPPSSDPYPSDWTLTELCQKYPNHVTGANLYPFLQYGWDGKRIFQTLPDQTNTAVDQRISRGLITRRLRQARAGLQRAGTLEAVLRATKDHEEGSLEDLINSDESQDNDGNSS